MQNDAFSYLMTLISQLNTVQHHVICTWRKKYNCRYPSHSLKWFQKISHDFFKIVSLTKSKVVELCSHLADVMNDDYVRTRSETGITHMY